MSMDDQEFLEQLTPEEIETARGVLYAIALIRSQSKHGSVHINIVDGDIAEIDMQQRIRPKHNAPWREIKNT